MKTVIFVLAIVLGLALADNSGAAIGVRQQTLDDFKNAFFPWVVKQIQNVKIPDQESKGLRVKDIHLTNFKLPTNQVKAILQNGQIQLQANDFAIGVAARAEKKVLFAWIKDSVGITTSDTTIRMTIQVGYSGGHLTFGVPSVSVDIRHLRFSLGGFLGKIVAAIVNLFSNPIAKHLNGKIADIIKSATVQGLNKLAQTTPTQFPISNMPIEVSYAPFVTPAITAAYAAFGIDGTIFPKPTYKRPPFPSKPIPMFDTQEANGIQLFISEYMLNSGLWALTTAGWLTRTFNTASVPTNSPYQLTSSSLLPENVQTPTNPRFLEAQPWVNVPSVQVGEAVSAKIAVAPVAVAAAADDKIVLGPNVPLEFRCYVNTTNLPHITLQENKMGVSATGACDVYATIMKENKMILRLTGGVSVALNAVGDAASNSIKFSLLDLQIINLGVPKSLIGPVNLTEIQKKLNAILKIAVPVMNAEVQKHKLPLPQIPLAVISNFKLNIKNGYLEVSAKPTFKPFA